MQSWKYLQHPQHKPEPRAANRSHNRNRTPQTVLAAVIVSAILPFFATACGGGGSPTANERHSTTTHRLTAQHRGSRRHSRTAPAHPSTTKPAPTTTTTTILLHTNPAGTLPQTEAFPTTNSPQFFQEMAALWQGVQTGSATTASEAFFPEAAYVQVKAIGDPQGDWQYRLLTDFELDLAAAHNYLDSSPGAAQAKLLYVAVPGNEAAWITPGYCYNSIGYWHAPGARLVYEQAGQERSIGIASLISWRGEWYVVHLGAVLRSSTTGIVDDPSPGEGTFGQPGGC